MLVLRRAGAGVSASCIRSTPEGGLTVNGDILEIYLKIYIGFTLRFEHCLIVSMFLRCFKLIYRLVGYYFKQCQETTFFFLVMSWFPVAMTTFTYFPLIC